MEYLTCFFSKEEHEEFDSALRKIQEGTGLPRYAAGQYLLLLSLSVLALETEKADPDIFLSQMDKLLGETEAEPNDGCVYVLKVQDEEIFKVGYTKSQIGSRISQIQHGNHKKLELYAALYTESAKCLERDFLDSLCGNRLRGEWFQTSLDVVDKLILDEIERRLLEEECCDAFLGFDLREKIGKRLQRHKSSKAIVGFLEAMGDG